MEFFAKVFFPKSNTKFLRKIRDDEAFLGKHLEKTEISM